jgi:hypothetical protein
VIGGKTLGPQSETCLVMQLYNLIKITEPIPDIVTRGNYVPSFLSQDSGVRTCQVRTC